MGGLYGRFVYNTPEDDIAVDNTPVCLQHLFSNLVRTMSDMLFALLLKATLSLVHRATAVDDQISEGLQLLR